MEINRIVFGTYASWRWWQFHGELVRTLWHQLERNILCRCTIKTLKQCMCGLDCGYGVCIMHGWAITGNRCVFDYHYHSYRIYFINCNTIWYQCETRLPGSSLSLSTLINMRTQFVEVTNPIRNIINLLLSKITTRRMKSIQRRLENDLWKHH